MYTDAVHIANVSATVELKKCWGILFMSHNEWNEMPVHDVSYWLQYYSKSEILWFFSSVI